ncbi:hypothetical protein MAR_036210 [Mya arenaria]|uniref:Tyrosine-protein kinase ephrin type A/B receptor-like domain-containing protein n=1 Tax=Mya arenaria TaxID=6604 RepID=A0ABY7ERV4_MYAAR|nr:hypothetical protein MAR_036210 [Mya arenaria]
MTFAGYPCEDCQYCPEGADLVEQCKAGAIESVMCPAGYREKIGALRVTFDDTCEPFCGGYYSAADGSSCLPCRTGVVCLDKATSDNPVANNSNLAYIFGPNGTQSYLCPPGYYCPDASAYETGCPTYNYEEGMTALSDSQNCPINHFNHLTGQTGCFYCGGEAQQPLTGQPTCQCSGNGSDFQYCGEEKYLGFYAQKGIWTCKQCVTWLVGRPPGTILNGNVKTNIIGNATQDSTYTYSGRHRLLATTMLSGVNYTGITNPIVCLKYADFMMWAVDNNNYPIYDRNNLFNTNSQFDYGGFHALAEAQARVGTSTTLFAYQFKDPGTYVLQQCRPV